MPSDLEQDEPYASEEDSDYTPDDAPEKEHSAASDDDEGNTTATPGGRKRPSGDNAEAHADDAGFENSGDEAIIEKGKKKRKKTAHKDDDAVGGEDEGGEGGLIKTRSMRAQEKAERRVAAVSGPVTIDVDAVWAQMTSVPVVPPKASAVATATDRDTQGARKDQDSAQQLSGGLASSRTESSGGVLPDMVRIKRTYNFAGKIQTEEKLVARDSAEAKLYLASLDENGGADGNADAEPAKRLPRKAFRSKFEPLVELLPQRGDLNLGVSVRLKAREAKEASAKKLNTVEKSRMDWAGYVDKEGIKEELELAGRSKESYTGRQDFLARSDALREDDARRARLAGRT